MWVEYAYRCSPHRGERENPLTAVEASQRDARGDEYAALVWEPGAPQPIVVSVQWPADTVEVQFADDPGRLRVSYRFNRTDPRTLFLSCVCCYFYPSEEPGLSAHDCDRLETHRFDQDGRLTATVEDRGIGETVTTKYEGINLDCNWEPVPRFGHWDSITRYER